MFLVDQLLTETTHDAEVESLLAFLQASGLDVGSLGSGDFGRAFIELLAESRTRLQNEVVAATIKNFYLDTATGIALSFIAKAFFDEDRIQRVGTQGTITLSDDAGDGPYTITTAMAFVDSVEGLTYHVVTGGTLSASGTLNVDVECDVPGAGGNVPNGTITRMQSPIAGVSVTNGISGGASWITRLGTDYEKDPILRQRCRTKFATYSANSPRGAYENLVLAAVDGSGNPVGISKVWVNSSNPGGPGTVWVYIANQTATATVQQVSDVQAYISDGRVSPAAIPTVIAATEVAVDISGVLYVRAGFAVTALAAVTEAHQVYIAGTDDADDQEVGLPLGGKQLDVIPGGAGYVFLSDLIKLAKDVEGVVDIVLSSPGANLPLAGNELALVGSITLSVVEI